MSLLLVYRKEQKWSDSQPNLKSSLFEYRTLGLEILFFELKLPLFSTYHCTSHTVNVSFNFLIPKSH